MAAFLDACRFSPTLGGTTDWTYSSAVTGYQSPALAGVVNGRIYKYRAESSDLSQWEIGEGAYNTSTGVLARTTVLQNSSGTGTAAGQSGAGTKIAFSAVPQVAIIALKEDLLSIEEANAFTVVQKAQAQTNLDIPALMRGFISGLTLANDGVSPNTVFDVAIGVATADDQSAIIKLGSAYTKTLGAWALGTGNGALDTGAVANNTGYHVFLIRRPDTGVVDILASLSATAPTMPTNYTQKRRIGWIKTGAATTNILGFVQIGMEFMWKATILDVNASGIGTTAGNATLTVPNGVSVKARMIVRNNAATATVRLWVYSPLVPDEAISATEAISVLSSTTAVLTPLEVWTDTTKNVRVVGDVATGTYDIRTLGWTDLL